MKVCAFRRAGGRGWSHFLNQPLAPCLGTTRHKILADDKISMFQQRPLQRKCLSDAIFTSYFEWKEKTAKNVYFGSLVNNKETKKLILIWNSDSLGYFCHWRTLVLSNKFILVFLLVFVFGTLGVIHFNKSDLLDELVPVQKTLCEILF